MSADNGIYILKTKDRQYRVAHLQAIDNAYWSAIDGGHQELVPTRVVEMWGYCKFTRDKNKALNIAHKWASKLPICEYGVNIITCDKSWKRILEDAQKYARKEIDSIKSWHQEGLWDVDELQRIADGHYISEWENREKYYKDLRERDCGYWSVCYDKGCKCAIENNVDGFDNNVYEKLRQEYTDQSLDEYSAGHLDYDV